MPVSPNILFEEEFLFNPEARFRVVRSSRKTQNGRTIVTQELEIVPE
jgi:hypothetical protein